MNTQILEDLGLTGAEIRVFFALLELGSSSAGKIVEKSGLQNAVVHRAFHSLAEKGLINSIMNGKIKIYRAIQPKQLLNFIDEKRSQLEKIIPELEAKQSLESMKPNAALFEGIRGVKELINSMIETKEKEYFSYGGPKKSNELLGEHFWENFHNRRIKKKIEGKLLFHNSLKGWGEFLKRKKRTNVKYTKQDFESLTETIICGEKVGIIIYLRKPYGFLLTDKTAAESYRKFFEILWKMANN